MEEKQPQIYHAPNPYTPQIFFQNNGEILSMWLVICKKFKKKTIFD